MADTIGTKEFAKKYGCSQQSVSSWCRRGLIPDTSQDAKGSPWHIPKDAKPPKNAKIKKQK